MISAAVAASLLLCPSVATAVDGDDLSADELAEQAKDNFLEAKSVHLRYTERSEAPSGDRTRPAALDLALDQDGNCVGSLTMASGGGHVDLVKRGDQVWMKPDAAFWKAQLPGPQGNAAAELFKDRYVHGTTENDLLKGMAETCDLAEFQHEVEGEVTDEAELTKGAETTRDGTDVIPLSSTDDGKEHVLYVTSDEPHLLAEATEKSGSAGKETFIDLRFDDYDKPVPSKTPPPDETVEVDRLQQLGA